MNRAFRIAFVLYGSGWAAWRAEPSALPISTIYTISLDGESPKSVQVRVSGSPRVQLNPESDPQLSYLVRARAFQSQLTQIFRSIPISATKKLGECLAEPAPCGKGVRNLLCEAPSGPFRQKVPDTFSGPTADLLAQMSVQAAGHQR